MRAFRFESLTLPPEADAMRRKVRSVPAPVMAEASSNLGSIAWKDEESSR